MRRLLLPACTLVSVCTVVAEPLNTAARQLPDPVGDAVVRRTDPGADGPLGLPGAHRLPDVLRLDVGNWEPYAPALDVYDGQWTSTGQFLRVDLILDGLLNPPGLLALDAIGPFTPFLYGPNPVFGFVELDIDASVSTGGATGSPSDRYLANAARFGGKPSAPRFADRVALSGFDILNDFATPPYVQRSGEEFHIPLIGDHISMTQEVTGDGDLVFEAGETWLVQGKLFHRAHGYEQFSFAVGPPLGAYEPVVELMWRHVLGADRTIVTLIYPLTNEAWIARSGVPQTVVINGDAGDQNSVLEALEELRFSAMNASAEDRLDPRWPIIAEWELQNPSAYLLAEAWEATVIVGMSYTQADTSGALYAWTDLVDSVVVGDVNGDGLADEVDAQQIDSYIQTYDGNVGVDADAVLDARVTLINFGPNFSVYDLNYDGFVDEADTYGVVILGDMDLDLDVDMDDVDDFVAAVLDGHTAPTPQDQRLLARGDFNGDGVLNGEDVSGFCLRLLKAN